jgi:hypothetical protein
MEREAEDQREKQPQVRMTDGDEVQRKIIGRERETLPLISSCGYYIMNNNCIFMRLIYI